MIRLPHFPLLVQILLAGTFLTRTTFYMVWPFLAVILIRDFHLPPTQIGFILGSASMARNATGFYLGNLSDRFGRRKIMVAGCAGSVAAFLVMATANSVLLYSLGAILVGLCSQAIETPASALIAESIEDQPTRELAFHARYFLANVGASGGPMIGFIFGLAARQTTFWVTAFTDFLFAIALVVGFRWTPEILSPHAQEDAHLAAALKTLNNDRGFLMLMLATFLVYVGYSQLESTLVQYLNLDGRGAGVGLVTATIATNGLTIVVFQFPLLRLLRPYDLYIRIYAGLGLFVAGFVIYAFLPVAFYSGWVLATLILSMGEAILFPTLNLQADRMAPAHLRGSYFGAITLAGMGFAAGPLIGGAMLQYFGGPLTFSMTALITGLGGLSYWQSSRMIPRSA